MPICGSGLTHSYSHAHVYPASPAATATFMWTRPLPKLQPCPRGPGLSRSYSRSTVCPHSRAPRDCKKGRGSISFSLSFTPSGSGQGGGLRAGALRQVSGIRFQGLGSRDQVLGMRVEGSSSYRLPSGERSGEDICTARCTPPATQASRSFTR